MNIQYIDDDADAILIFEEALFRINPAIDLVSVTSTATGLDYFRHHQPDSIFFGFISRK